jgi:hypothetical protein
MYHAYDVPSATCEHVTLPSDPLDLPEEVEPSTIDAEIEHERGGVSQRTTIFNGAYLSVGTRCRHGSERWYWLNLAFLDATPVRRADRLRVTAAVACALPVAAVVALLLITDPAAERLWSLYVPGAGSCMALGLGLALHDYFDRLVFCTRHGRVPVLTLRRSRPDTRSVREFLDRLDGAVSRVHRERAGARGPYLRDEMKEHRRLLEQGVMSADDFESARASILRAHG